MSKSANSYNIVAGEEMGLLGSAEEEKFSCLCKISVAGELQPCPHWAACSVVGDDAGAKPPTTNRTLCITVQQYSAVQGYAGLGWARLLVTAQHQSFGVRTVILALPVCVPAYTTSPISIESHKSV